jgi:hypothetical protein
MNFIERALSNVTENIGEGRRWSGRTQSSESRSPEQLRHENRLKVDGAVRSQDQAGTAFVPMSLEVVRYETMVQRDARRIVSS